MSNINITQNKNTVTVNGETRVVTVKTAGPQGTFTDGNLGDVTVSSNGTNIVVNSGAINNAKVASNAAIAGTKISPDFGSQNITTTGNLTLSSTSPSILLTEGDANPDYIIKSQGGAFDIPLNHASKVNTSIMNYQQSSDTLRLDATRTVENLVDGGNF